jgi:hypothetical protein
VVEVGRHVDGRGEDRLRLAEVLRMIVSTSAFSERRIAASFSAASSTGVVQNEPGASLVSVPIIPESM